MNAKEAHTVYRWEDVTINYKYFKFKTDILNYPGGVAQPG